MPNNTDAHRFFKDAHRLVILWLPVAACMGFIFYAGSLPARDVPALFAGQDIVFHLGTYLLLGFYFCRALRKAFSEIAAVKAVLIALLFILFYGITDELHQGFTPGRSVAGFDVFIDSLGGLSGSLIYFAIKSWLKSGLFRQ